MSTKGRISKIIKTRGPALAGSYGSENNVGLDTGEFNPPQNSIECPVMRGSALAGKDNAPISTFGNCPWPSDSFLATPTTRDLWGILTLETGCRC